MPRLNMGGVVHGGVAVGDKAPEFELPALIAGVKKSVRLADYRGQRLVLAFYSSNWEAESAEQLRQCQAHRAQVLASHAETIAIGVDSIMNTTAWEREIGPLEFPICSDFWPHGAVCARYGVLRESGTAAGAAEPAIFLLDAQGRIAFQRIYHAREIPQLEELLPMLEKV